MPPRRDDDYMDIESDSGASLIIDDDDPDFEGARSKGPTAAKSKKNRRKDKGKGKTKEQPYAWEASYTRSWDAVQEDETGSLQHAVDDLMAQGRRRRLLAPTAAIRRTIIRHLILLLDLSNSMMDRDMRPTRFDLTLEYAREFISEWFDQNPLGQMGVVGMRSGVAERLGEMAGNQQDVLKSLEKRTSLEPAGEPSLQNAIEMAKASMAHLPTHSSREILIIYGSLTTVDPGNIHDTLEECIKDKIRISVVSLSAEMKICRELCDKTGGTFGVALNEGHFKDLLFELIPPPAQRSTGKGLGSSASDLMMMGFPTRLPDSSPKSLCVCHSILKSEGFVCPRCYAKLCDIPTDCDICGLMIVSSPHLARSYHHLFPVKAFTPVMEIPAEEQSRVSQTCHACFTRLNLQPASGAAPVAAGLSPLDRYRCPECHNDFCAECDLFIHEVVHVCPGCG